MSPTTGKTKRKLPSLASVQSNISLLAHSPSGGYLGGLTTQGDMFLWEKETDIVKSFVTPLSWMDSESVKTDPLAFQGTCVNKYTICMYLHAHVRASAYNISSMERNTVLEASVMCDGCHGDAHVTCSRA